ncbi:MAG TPA: S-layer homology domain-containing protein [Syntrophomonadaceae bacterium]|nr:S-layer homology domain-containing protein [Syntrophomonadaceae bacterium]HQD91132.1 S-layer homology domain-containing protein [Syntrophomonadaceae bacterium]
MLKRFAAIIAAISFLFFMPSQVIASSDLIFSDTKDHWAQSYIAKAAQQNLMQGIGKNEQGDIIFAPNELVSRSQAAAVLERAFGFDYDEQQFAQKPVVLDYFQDVGEQSWYANAVLLCTINEIFPFKGDHFFPDRTITRLEMAQAIQSSFTAQNINVVMIMLMPDFNDTKNLSNEEMNAVVFVHNTGIMKGNDGNFRPYDNLTRAELARVITACKELIDLNTQPDSSQAQASLSLEKKILKEQQENMTVDLELPLIVGMADGTLQDEINSRWEKEAADFRQEVASTLEEYVNGAQTYGYPVRNYEAVSRVQKSFLSDGFLSLYIDYYSYTGGAHGFTDRRAYNIDLTTGRELRLSDLFAPDFNYISIINEEIKKQIQAGDEIFFDGELGFQSITENQPFYIEEGNLVIYFGLYEIAPYAAGIQEFRFPLDRFGNNLIAGLF